MKQSVCIKYYGALRELIGLREESARAARVSGVLREIRRRHGAEAMKAARRCGVCINGAAVRSLRAPLGDGDSVEFRPICGGG